MPEVNYVAVLVAALASFLVGAVWYSPPLFANSWMAENGKTMASVKSPSPPKGRLYATAFITAFIAAFVMAGLLVTMQHHGLQTGLKRGFAAGAGWVAMCFGSSYAFEGKSLRHWAINAGYFVVQFTVMGAILGVMNH